MAACLFFPKAGGVGFSFSSLWARAWSKEGLGNSIFVNLEGKRIRFNNSKSTDQVRTTSSVPQSLPSFYFIFVRHVQLAFFVAWLAGICAPSLTSEGASYKPHFEDIRLGIALLKPFSSKVTLSPFVTRTASTTGSGVECSQAAKRCK